MSVVAKKKLTWFLPALLLLTTSLAVGLMPSCGLLEDTGMVSLKLKINN